MAGLDFWQVTGPAATTTITRPDGSPYPNPFGAGNLTGTTTIGNPDLEPIASGEAVPLVVNAAEAITGQGNFIIANRRVIIDGVANHGAGGGPRIHLATLGSHLWFVNCSIEIRGTLGLATGLTSASSGTNNFVYNTPTLGEGNQLTSNSINLLGCDLSMIIDGTIASTFIHGFGYVEDSVITGNRDQRTYQHLNGSFINSRFDNSQVTNIPTGGGGLFWTVNQGARFEGVTFLSNTLVWRKTAGGSIVAPISNFANQYPRGFGNTNGEPDGKIITVVTLNPSGTRTGFRFDNPVEFTEYTFPASGNEINAGDSLSPINWRADVPNVGSGADNFRVAATANFNPFFFDNSQVVGDARRDFGIPNIYTVMERGFNFASANTVDLVQGAVTTNNRSAYLTNRRGVLESLDVNVYNPNGDDDPTTGAPTGTNPRNATLAAGVGLRTPYVMIGSPNFAPIPNNLAAQSAIEARLYRSRFTSRSLSHNLGNTLEVTAQIGPEYHLADSEDANPATDVLSGGTFAAVDTRVSEATRTAALSEISTTGFNVPAFNGDHVSVRADASLMFTGFNPGDVNQAEAPDFGAGVWRNGNYYIWQPAVRDTGWHISTINATDPWAFELATVPTFVADPRLVDSTATSSWRAREAGGNAAIGNIGTAQGGAQATTSSVPQVVSNHLDAIFSATGTVSPQDIYDALRYLHTFSLENEIPAAITGVQNGAFDYTPATATVGGLEYLSGDISIIIDDTITAPFTWNATNRVFTIRTNGIVASAEGDEIQGIQLEANAASLGGTFDAGSKLLTGLNLDVDILTGLISVVTTSATPPNTSISGGIIDAALSGLGDRRIDVSGSPDLSAITVNVTGTEMVTISGTFEPASDAPTAANILLLGTINIEGLIGTGGTDDQRGYLTVWTRATADGPFTRVGVDQISGFDSSGDPVNGTEDGTGVFNNTAAAYVGRIVDGVTGPFSIAGVSSADTYYIVQTHPLFQGQTFVQSGGGTLTFANAPLAVPRFADIPDTTNIVPGAVNFTDNQLTLLTTSSFDAPPSPSVTSALVHRDVKASEGYHTLLAALGQGNDSAIFNSPSATSPAEMSVDRFLFTAPTDTLQGLGFINPLDAVGDETLSTPGLDANRTGVLVFPITDFDLALTTNELSSSVNNVNSNLTVRVLQNYLDLQGRLGGGGN